MTGTNQFTATGTAQTAPVRFAGTVSANSVVTLDGQPATGTAGALAWEKTLTLATGTHSLTLLATETNPPQGAPAETTRRKVNLTLAAGPAWSFGYDDNGSMLSALRAPSSALAFEWDAANRLSAIVKDGQRTELSYDGQNRWAALVEKTGTGTTAPVLNRRRFVWEGYSIAQIREYDASDTLTGVRHLFAEGEVRTTNLAQSLSTGTSLLYLRDHLGSVRELVNASDLAVRARYDYDPYGQRTANLITSNALDCDFGFTGHYEHASGLTLAPFRAYDSVLGRWLSRDPIEEDGGINLYGYVLNSPSGLTDRTGEDPADWADSLDGYLNVAQDFYTTDRHWIWDGTVGTGSDLLRGIADVFRFGDGAGRALYDPCLDRVDRGGAVLQDLLRGTSLVSGGGAATLRGGAWLGGTRAGQLLNHNRYLRLGPGNVPRGAAMSRGAGRKVPTLRIGNQKPSSRNHFDLRVFGY